MKKSDLAKMKKNELAAYAKKEGVKTDEKMSKEDIIKAISASAAKTTAVPAVKKTSKPAVKKSPDKKKAHSAPKTPAFHDMGDAIYGEAKKFEIEDKRGYVEPSYEIAGEKTYVLPEEYGETRITLLVQDPSWVHAYWEISADTRKRYNLEKGKHGKNVVIRMYHGDNSGFIDIPVQETAKSWYFNIPRPNQSYYAELGILEANKVFYKIAKSNTIVVPNDRAAVESEQMTFEEKGKAEELFKESGGYIIHKLVGSQVVSQWMSGQSSESSHVSSGSGGMAFPQVPGRNFWAELYTELIVHGATRPDAKVTVGGVPMKLSPDGKFSIRFILNDGSHSVPVVAVSHDNIDRIEITPIVGKQTDRKESKIG